MKTSAIDFVIFSVHQASKTEADNAKNNKAARLGLESSDIFYSSVVGSYKGVIEDSLLVKVSGDYTLSVIDKLCELFNQESILVVSKQGKAYLRYYTETHLTGYIGNVSYVDSVKDNADFTKLADNKYLIVR